jgi:hypothetical protein
MPILSWRLLAGSEGALGKVKDGAFQALAWLTGSDDGVSFFPTDGSSANVTYTFRAVDSYPEVLPG